MLEFRKVKNRLGDDYAKNGLLGSSMESFPLVLTRELGRIRRQKLGGIFFLIVLLLFAKIRFFCVVIAVLELRLTLNLKILPAPGWN